MFRLFHKSIEELEERELKDIVVKSENIAEVAKGIAYNLNIIIKNPREYQNKKKL